LPLDEVNPADIRQYAEQSRFVSGKTFFQNEGKWVDSETQKLSAAKTVRIRFGSVEYFDLLKREPHAVTWLALGPNVQFISGGTLYEIHE
jgi:hypothetical protein